MRPKTIRDINWSYYWWTVKYGLTTIRRPWGWVLLGVFAALLVFEVRITIQGIRWMYGHTDIPSVALNKDDKLRLAITLVVGAIAATFIRHRFQKWYGVAEAVFGVTSAWQVLGRLTNDRLTNVMALVGATYLVGRGTTNIFDALRREIKEHEEAQALPQYPVLPLS
jgi:hypothetical protein